MKPGTGMVGMLCAWVLMAACAHEAGHTPPRAPSSVEAEEAPARPIATSLAEDPLHASPTAAEDDAAQQHAAASYTCPMHPEIQQAGPGECPKCGMRLVPQAGAHQHSSPQAEPAHEHAN